MQLLLLLLVAQLRTDSLPAPRGFVNDFAAVIPTDAAARIEAICRDVRAKTQGDIAVVTLPDLGGRPAGDVALQLGRAWKVGGTGEAGDPARNLGVVVLVVPRKNHQPGTGDLFISTGRGAEGFLPDGRVGRIRDAMGPFLAREDYGGGLETGVRLLAQAFADEFHVTLDSSSASSPPEERPLPGPGLGILGLVVLLIVLRALSRASRMGRRRAWWWTGGGWGGGGGGWSGGGFGGWGGGGGGGGGGGFGGFGGGGGFSGGGAGGKF